MLTIGFLFTISFKELLHQLCYLRVMTFESEVTAWDKMNLGVWQVTLEGFGSGRDERRVILAPDGQQRRLVVAKIFLELRVIGAWRK